SPNPSGRRPISGVLNCFPTRLTFTAPFIIERNYRGDAVKTIGRDVAHGAWRHQQIESVHGTIVRGALVTLFLQADSNPTWSFSMPPDTRRGHVGRLE